MIRCFFGLIAVAIAVISAVAWLGIEKSLTDLIVGPFIIVLVASMGIFLIYRGTRPQKQSEPKADEIDCLKSTCHSNDLIAVEASNSNLNDESTPINEVNNENEPSDLSYEVPSIELTKKVKKARSIECPGCGSPNCEDSDECHQCGRVI